MARAKTSSSVPNPDTAVGQPQIYAEGKHDYNYLTTLTNNGVILKWRQGTRLRSTEIKRRIEAIRLDIDNEAIEHVIWIVDGRDQHIKESQPFIKFYKEWRVKKDSEWKKLHILINSPCLEYWFLLHRTDPPLDVKKGTPICFENPTALDDSTEFKKHCPEGKGANLVRNIAENAVERKQAIQRAKSLNNQLNHLTEKNLLNIARAEMYQVFELIKVESPSYSSHKIAR
jgi:hypothetical protein